MFVLIGAIWRMVLWSRFAGWEESDYGNLAMVRGVLDGGFLHHDMNHMPGYYALGALALGALELVGLGDAVWAAKGVSLVGGLVALGLAVWLTDRLAGRKAAWVAGAVLVIQPEFSLYAATALREPIYAAFLLGCLCALVGDRLVMASFLAGAAFLVRMEGLLAMAPVLGLAAMSGGDRGRRILRAWGPLTMVAIGWSLYCHVEHGTWRFWSHSVAINVETGLGGEGETPLGWTLGGLRVVGGLGAWLLPWRLGWLIWLGLGVTWLTTPWRHPGPTRLWSLAGLSLLGVWLGMGFMGQHAPTHNLYWKWLCPLVPVLAPLGAAGLVQLTDRLAPLLGPLAARAILGLALVQVGISHLQETGRQVARADAWYRPQLELGQWFEAEVSPTVPLLVDNIPACWLNRRHHERTMWSWFDVPTTTRAGLGEWLRTEEIGWVMWFRESWTQSPRIAPFLAGGGAVDVGGLTLVETRREDGYGWILYEVRPTLDRPQPMP